MDRLLLRINYFFPIVQYQEKLSKNQDSFVQLRKEKDEMQQDFW